MLHNRTNIQMNKNEIFRVFTVVTLRQVLTQITSRVFGIAGGQDQLTKRKNAESIAVNAVINIIAERV